MSPGTRQPLLLASASPRRRRLISWLGLPVKVTSVDTPEELDSPLASDPATLVTAIAMEKAEAALPQAGSGQVVLACDTVVEHGGSLLGKPVDLEDAYRMLQSLSAREHHVITGVAIRIAGSDVGVSYPVKTRVNMHALTAAEIDAWAAKGELLGCAGAYNIESHLASVDATECYRNVAGLPLCHIYQTFASGLVPGLPDGLTSPLTTCEADRCAKCILGRHLAG